MDGGPSAADLPAKGVAVDVEVRLFAGFRQGRFKRQTVSLPEGALLRDVIGLLDIAEEEVSIRLINGHYSPLDQELVANDIVSLFPAVAGG